MLNKQLINKLISSLDGDFPLGLTYGKMGVCIYFYQMERLVKTDQYRVIGDKVLDDVLTKISSVESLNVEDGLAGIALGLIFLVRKKYIEANLNELLVDVDDVIYKYLMFHENKSIIPVKDILGYIYYFNIRLEEISNEQDQSVFKDVIAYLVDCLFENVDENFFDDYDKFSVYYYQLPLLFFVFAGLLEKGIYTSRIFHILNEWKMRLITRIPLLHMNRLYLLWGMLTIKPFLKDTDFIQYVDQIKRSVDVKYLIEREINIKNIFVTNGYSLLFVLLKLIDKKYPLYSFVYDENQIVDKIKTSPAWKDLQDVPSFYRIHRGLLNGFLGVDLLLFSNEMLDK
ncbi:MULTISPECIES: hypothetical protein [Parabacteroides]|uniref:Lanthionine synthetase C-like protein n=1 Tax=Parabacteroides distasonis TaxID=823 RepID=A0A174T6H6_PARDI|nr:MULTISPECIES: hypothetical protein [Parabacteroides]MRY84686.1 hypothetical protein [Parabacteroides distasonis]MRZ06022.1 hypothetical protein [Parabacteroides distasonis]RLT71249.1 hypothetical protein D7V92_02820 [Parabacteroides sp. CH2-D42-20]WMI41061.1 hypothetical protein Q8809_13875 [Parabacteroides distasonis]CUQ05543.1 Uncharacterised protein [Parabacteroides distasonis]